MTVASSKVRVLGMWNTLDIRSLSFVPNIAVHVHVYLTSGFSHESIECHLSLKSPLSCSFQA